jgi:CRISPR-associated endonuclease Csn1
MGERQRILGIDLGIASCGWAVIEVGEKQGQIVSAGVRCFDAPLVDKTGEPKSAARRGARGQRRVIRRRRQRMNAVRALLRRSGLVPNDGKDALAEALRRISPKDRRPQLTPWQLRSAGYARALSADEFAVALGHIARHRGFRSNSKREASANAADETSKMKRAMEQTREGLARYHSFGDMIANDEKFAVRKRNRDKDYSHTAKRSDLEDEVRLLFAAQRRFGNPLATAELEAEFIPAAFNQRPLQDNDDKVGPCPFELDQKRTARRAPSFELFRFLSKLATLTISVGRVERRLSPEEITIAAGEFGKNKSFSYTALRKALDLDPNARFSGIARDKEKLDVAARSGAAAEGTHTLRKVLGDAPWQSLSKTAETLDRIAEILSFREDLNSIRTGLEESGLERLIVDQLMTAAGEGAFNEFTKAAHISALAARNIIPGLREGLNYSEACARVGYDHSARPAVALKDIGSPVTRRAFGEAVKQVRAVTREYGPIDVVHIELARDVGKSAEERREITDGIEARNAEKDKRKQEAADLLKRAISDDELMRYELAKEQTFKCVYCDGEIAPNGFASNDTRWQVDHILPWSRFGDDSYRNKTLCCAKCNQDKRGRTPFEWFESDKTEKDWDTFVARCESLKEMKGLKKRNFKLRDAASIEDKFKERNLTDTKWVTRLLADELKRMFPAPAGTQRVFTRPGAITSKLRRAWGLEGLKKVSGERVSDDRHHAVDALVLAATTNSLLIKMTKEVQAREKKGRQDDIFHVQQPWPGFRLDVTRIVYGENGSGGVFVSRAERRRARGKAHDATVKQVKVRDGETIVYERRSIEKLSEKDLLRIKDAERNHRLVEVLREWITAGKPKDKPPIWKYSSGSGAFRQEPIRKVRLATNDKPTILLNGGTVDRGDMARVDVFRRANKKRKWEYLVVPIHPHQIATMDSPPNRAVKGGGGEEAEWILIDETAEFLWSLHSMSFLEIVKSDGEVIEGYFRSFDRNTGAITVSPQITAAEIRKGIGVKTLASFKKFTVDRLGRKFEIKREQRTWRGKTLSPAENVARIPLAYRVSSPDGMERPASDAAE